MIKKYLKDITGGASIIFLGIICGYFFNYLTRLIIARFIGPEGYGIISLGIAILSIFSIISILGMSYAVPKFISDASNKKRKALIIRTSLTLTFPLSIVLSIILYFSSYYLGNLFNQSVLVGILKIFSFSLPLFVSMNVLIGVFQGLKDPKRKIIHYDILFNFMKFFTTIIIILIGGGVVGLALGWHISYIITTIVAFIFINKKIPIFNLITLDSNLTKKILLFSTPMVFVGVSEMLLSWTGLIIIGIFMNAEAVGMYNVALPTAALFTIFSASLGFIFMPMISKLYQEKKLNKIKQIYISVVKLATIILIPFTIFFLYFSDLIISLLFGTNFIAAATPLRILTIGYFFWTLSSLSWYTNIAIGKTKFTFFTNFIVAVSNLIMNIIFIPIYGINGAAVAMSISLILGASLSIYLTHKLLKN